MSKQYPLKNYGNPYAKQAAAFKVRDAQEKQEAAQTLRDVQSGKPMMGRNQ